VDKPQEKAVESGQESMNSRPGMRQASTNPIAFNPFRPDYPLVDKQLAPVHRPGTTGNPVALRSAWLAHALWVRLWTRFHPHDSPPNFNGYLSLERVMN
jgi:hypothetical protein